MSTISPPTNDNPADRRRTSRGRRTKTEGREIDERILQAAWDSFVSRGYEGASMERIADQAEVTRMTVYSRHPNKIALLRAAVEHRVRLWAELGHRSDWMRGRTLEERLTNYGQQVLLWSSDEEVAATRRFVEGASGEAALAAQELDFTIREPVIAEITEEVRRHCIEADLPCEDPREIALLFMGMLEAVWKSAPNASPENYVDRVEKVVAILSASQRYW